MHTHSYPPATTLLPALRAPALHAASSSPACTCTRSPWSHPHIPREAEAGQLKVTALPQGQHPPAWSRIHRALKHCWKAMSKIRTHITSHKIKLSAIIPPIHHAWGWGHKGNLMEDFEKDSLSQIKIKPCYATQLLLKIMLFYFSGGRGWWWWGGGGEANEIHGCQVELMKNPLAVNSFSAASMK